MLASRQTTSSANEPSSRHTSRGATGTASDEPLRLARSQRERCRAHRRAGGEPIVDQDDRAPADVDRAAPRAVGALAPLQLATLPDRDARERLVGDPERGDDIVVHDPRAVARDGSERELLPARRPELAHEIDVERDAELAGELESDHHAAAGQREDEHVTPVRIRREGVCEGAAGVATVPEAHLTRRSATESLRRPRQFPRRRGSGCRCPTARRCRPRPRRPAGRRRARR